MASPNVLYEERLNSRRITRLLATAGVAVFLATMFSFIAGKKVPTPMIAFIECTDVILIGTACAIFSRLLVQVQQSDGVISLVLNYGPGGKIRQTIPSRDIISAKVGNYSFMQLGGYGYRGSLRLLRRAALATRSGAALDLNLVGGRRFQVTVDHPEKFIEALGITRID